MDKSLNSNNSEIKDELDNCTEDKVCVYETVISIGYIKQEPNDMEDEPGSVHNSVNVKDEVIENSTQVVQETGGITSIKENYPICCEDCGEEYDLYCLKCPMLIRIFNNNNANLRDNRVILGLPQNFVDMYETQFGVGIVALRVIPNGVVFGPFEGLDSIKDGTVSKWKLKNEELVYTKDPKPLNWMQYIRRTHQHSDQNLTSFQYKDALYYRSNCNISVGDELLVCRDSVSEETAIQNMEDTYWKPWFCERLDDTYACTFCCVGYKSIKQLKAHNSRCPEKRNQRGFSREIIQCAFCQIYLHQTEYSDYHIDRCCESSRKKHVAALCSPKHSENLESKDKFSLCEYSTLQQDKFRRHQQSHTELRMYNCSECPYQVRTTYKLQRHMRTHLNHSRIRFECQQCGERFTRADCFVLHQKQKHFVSVYKCDKCIVETTNAKDLECHLATHVDTKPYPCNACGKQFKLEISLLRHVRNVHDAKKRKYKCPKCDFESTYGRSMKEHLLIVHSGIKRFKCPRCAFKTSYKSTLQLHLRYHEDAKPIKCESCDAEFWNAQALGRHQKKVHAIANKRFRCCKCDYGSNHKFHYKQHLRVHDGLKPFACAICPFKTNTKESFKRHITVTHNDDKPFKCDICLQMFKAKYSLTKHLRYVHPKAGKREDEETEYKCCKCAYRTYRKDDFDKHVRRVHDGLKPFACTICTHKTTTNWKLKRHMVTHNDDKPFKCDKCPKVFKGKAWLTEHARNIHSEVEKWEYECPQCPFGTNYKSTFVNHVNAHNKSELFRCSKCDFNTYNKRTFNLHRIRHERTKAHACHACSFRTNDERELDDHLKTHELVKPFEYDQCSKNMEDIDEIHAECKVFNGRERPKSLDCPTCGMTFNFIGHLTRHIKRLHASGVKEEKSLIESD